MDNALQDVLLNLDHGIVILNQQLNITIWNKYMQNIMGVSSEHAVNCNVYQILPNLNRNYFKIAIQSAFDNGCKMFFSDAMHRGQISEKEHFNLKLSCITIDRSKHILLEFIDVTNEYVRIHRLRNNMAQLCLMNKGLKDQQKEIKKIAYYDELTGVANRTLFFELAEKLLFDAKRNHYMLGLMFIDVNKFKRINDTYGHEIGDLVLTRVADVLKSSTRNNDVVARYGGDEFLVLLPHIQNTKSYKVIASKIVNAPNRFIRFGEHEIEMALSIGISFYPDNGKTIHQLIQSADKAMYVAKKEQKMCHCAVHEFAGIEKVQQEEL